MKSVRLKVWIVGVMLVAGLPLPAWSAGKILWGAEFTFFNPNTMDRTGTNLVVKRMREHLTVNQPKQFRFKETWFSKKIDKDMDFDGVPSGPGQAIGKQVSPDEATSLSIGRFTSPFGWWFEWGLDDKVMEVKTKPMTLEEYEKYEGNMHDAIFASANLEGMYAPAFLGGGHINLGMTAFEGNDLLLRNFVVDLFNHNELFMGVFNYDTHNAASLSIQTRKVQAAVAKVIADFDRGKFKGENTQGEFTAALQSAMNAEEDEFFAQWPKDDPSFEDSGRFNYFAVNFSHVVPGKRYSRIEIKAVRAQWSMNQWVRQIRLLTKRIKMLEQINKPIPLAFRVPVEKLSVKKHTLQPPIKASDALRSFYTYVTEAGESWEDHKDYLWLKWHSDGHIDAFENSTFYKMRQTKIYKATRSACDARLR